MPNFHYESLTSAGQVRRGIVSAVDRGDVVRQLLGRGETATTIVAEGGGASSNGSSLNGSSAKGITKKPTRRPRSGSKASTSKGAGGRSSAGWRRGTLSRSEMANLIREIATALEAGLPLMQSLRTVQRQAKNPALRNLLDHLIERVERGDPLHLAARDYGPPFDDMVIGMLRAADASGEMSEVLHQLADLLERSLELRREVAGALMYPMILATLIMGSIIVLVTVLVPRLIEPLAGNIGKLPWPTQILLDLATFFENYWFIVLGIATVTYVAWRTWIAAPANKLMFDRALLGLPVIGPLLRDVAVARFTRTLGTLAAAGLPLLESLRITKHTLVNTAMMSALDDVQDQVTSGKALADPLERSGLFPPLLVQVVNLGERSGRLEHMLLHSAGAFDRRVNSSITLFKKALPPFLLIFMAGIGGFVLAAVLLPLLELQNMVAA